MTERLPRIAASAAVAVATAIVLVALAILPFLNPAWVGFAQSRATAPTIGGPDFWSGVDRSQVTNAILGDLLLWRGDFEVAVRGEPVLSEAERSHMLDVRRVMWGFGLVAVAAAASLVAARRRATDEAKFWQAVRSGAAALAVGVVVVGAVSVTAFDAVFATFHRIFFSGGNWQFDPATDRLVQLFPYRFWVETSFALGAVILVLSVATIAFAGRRLGGSNQSSVVRPVPLEVGR